MKKPDQAVDKGKKSKSDHVRAVALQYEDPNELPRVIASGVDELARNIIALAQKNNVPIHQDSELASLLSDVAPGNSISKKTFRLVAEVISFLYHTDKDWQSQHSKLDAILK